MQELVSQRIGVYVIFASRPSKRDPCLVSLGLNYTVLLWYTAGELRRLAPTPIVLARMKPKLMMEDLG